MIILFVTQTLDLNAYKFSYVGLKIFRFLHTKCTLFIFCDQVLTFRDIFFFCLKSILFGKLSNSEEDEQKKIMDLKMREEQMDEDSFIE